MGRAFTPSRSMIYSQPDRAALMDVGDTLMGALQGWSEEEIQAEYISQRSAGQIAMQREAHALFGRLTTEKAREPGAWVPTFQQSKGKIREAVLKGVRQPRARQALELDLNENFARWEQDLGDQAKKQAGANAAADFVTHRDGILKESVQYAGQADMMSHLESALALVEENHNARGLPTHPDVGTRPQAEMQKRILTRHIVGNYLLQQALASGDDSYIEQANDVAPRSILDDQIETPLFGPEEMGDLRKRYKDAVNGAKAEAEKARKAQADVANLDITNRGMAGEFSRVDEKGNTITLLEEAQNNPYFAGPEKREVVSFVRGMMEAYGQGKEYDPVKKVEAYNEIASEPDPQKRMDLIKQHVAGLEWSQVKPFIDDLHNPKAPENSTATAALTGYMSAVRSMRTKTIEEDSGLKTDDERAKAIARMNADIARGQNEVLQRWRENPDLTPDQRLTEMEAILAPVRDEAAKETVMNLKTFLFSPIRKWPMWSRKKPAETVRVADPQGRIGTIAADELEEALKNGWRRVD